MVSALREWLDCWNGVGAVIVGMERQAYDLSLGHRKKILVPRETSSESG